MSQLATALLQSACDLITACLSPTTLASDAAQELLDRYLDLAMRRREEVCQAAAARTYGRLSELLDCAKEVKKSVVIGVNATKSADGNVQIGRGPQCDTSGPTAVCRSCAGLRPVCAMLDPGREGSQRLARPTQAGGQGQSMIGRPCMS